MLSALVLFIGGSAVAGICPGFGDCCFSHSTPGCDDTTCCNDVCAQDAFCCETEWDSFCVDIAQELCAACGPVCGDTICEPGETWPECPECPPVVACPGVGDCCVEHLSIGCTDRTCCEAVCVIDPFCCDSGWDAGCVNVAETECPRVCGPVCGDTVCEPGETWPECPECPPVVDCPGTGDCCRVHASAGCNDTTCCETVCTTDPACCDSAWDASCVSAAERDCGCGTSQPADIDGDGTVGQSDLAILLGDWGTSGGPSDIDGNGTVGQTDLAILLGAWG